MRRAAMLVLLIVFLLNGCATSGSGSYARISGTATVDTLEIVAPRTSGKTYYLFDGSQQTVARAVSANGRIRFLLPQNRLVGECVAVFDDRGRPLWDDRRKIRLAARSEHQEAWRRKQAISTDSEAAAARERRTRQQREAAESRLRANPAHAVGACRQLSSQPVPPRPMVRCASYDECLQDGAAICYTRYFGSKGCGMALDEFEIPGLLSSPGCAAAAAELAGDKYELGDAFVDALHGVIGDAGKEMMRSDDFLNQLLGLAVTLGNEYAQLEQAKTCANRFAERQFAPLRTWAAQVEQRRAEPGRLLAECQRDVAELRRMGQPATESYPADSAARLRGLDSRIAQLEREQRAISWCGY